MRARDVHTTTAVSPSVPAAALIALALVVLGGPIVRGDSVDELPGCRGLIDGRAALVAGTVTWTDTSDPHDRDALRSWCVAVGPPVLLDPGGGRQGRPVLESLAIVTWNTHEGGGDLTQLVADLRSGRLTDGQPIQHFVLLLQEAFRSGPVVPVAIPPEARTGSIISVTPRGSVRVDIAATAQQLGLSLFYIPVMRNGLPGDGVNPEDRGNAMLSTIPLTDHHAIELPLERQRRMAMTATVSGETLLGEPWSARLINVHLENRVRWSRLLDNFGASRLRQMRALLDVIHVAPPSILGGDLNTWAWESAEPAVERIEELFERHEAPPEYDTVEPGYLLPDRKVDYLFLPAARRLGRHVSSS
jgi:endonuclease/exonuclease/phosphatase family metal-dependent hydrolase